MPSRLSLTFGPRHERLRYSDEGSGVNRNRIMSPSLSLMRLPRRHYLRLGAAPLLFFLRFTLFCVNIHKNEIDYSLTNGAD